MYVCVCIYIYIYVNRMINMTLDWRAIDDQLTSGYERLIHRTTIALRFWLLTSELTLLFL